MEAGDFYSIMHDRNLIHTQWIAIMTYSDIVLLIFFKGSFPHSKTLLLDQSQYQHDLY